MRLTRDEIREWLCDISEKYCDADDLKTLHTCVQTKVFLKGVARSQFCFTEKRIQGCGPSFE